MWTCGRLALEELHTSEGAYLLLFCLGCSEGGGGAKLVPKDTVSLDFHSLAIHTAYGMF